MRQAVYWIMLISCSTLFAAGSPPLELKGPLVQGALVFGKTTAGSKVIQDGEPVLVSAEGDFLLGFGRQAPAQSTLEISAPDGEKLVRVLNVRKREYNIQRIDGLPERKVTPNPEDLSRIAEDRAAVKKARALRTNRTDYLYGFEWPVTGRISGVYGSQRILNGKPKWPHFGVDIARPTGTPVRAPAPGLVTLVRPDMFYSGGTLVLDHGQGLSSSFLHLSKILVKEGMRVNQGDVIAEVGATGRVTGPHLDWRMNLRNKRVNPETVVGAMPETTTRENN